MKSQIIRSLIIEAMERENINPYGITFYNTKRGLAIAFISAFGESVKDCFGYNENITDLRKKADSLCERFEKIDKPFA